MKTRSIFRKFGRARRGATAVEFAIICPVLLAFLFGIFEIGRVMYDQSRVAAAVANGARAVGLYGGSDTTNVTAAVRSRFTSAEQSRVNVTVTSTTFNSQPFRRVVVSYNFRFLIHFHPRFNNLTITATRYAPVL